MPPHKLRAMQNSISDKTSEKFQRIQWDALRKSINGLINKVGALFLFFACLFCFVFFAIHEKEIFSNYF